MSENENKHQRHLFDAYLGHHPTFHNYLRAYKSAFEVLLQSLMDSGHAADHLAFPILFIARHCLELGFKTNIRSFSKYSELNDFINTGSHNLMELFSAFKRHVYAAVKNLEKNSGWEVDKSDLDDFGNLCKKVEELASILHALDKGSDSFRYPVDKKNERSFEHDDKINLLDVQVLYDDSMTLLTYTGDVFSKYTDIADAMEEAYQQEMQDAYGSY